MNRTAYDESYLDSVMQKTRYLFTLIGRNSVEAFEVIGKYMQSPYRTYMDMGNPLYLNKTPKQILDSIGIQVKNEFELSEKYDESVLGWMADVYTYLQWYNNVSSKKIVEKIKPEVLYEKYSPLHETSLKNCVEKLKEIYQL